MQIIANISMLFTQRPIAERFAAAERAGFDGVEIQFPFEHEAVTLRQAARDVPVVLINLPAGRPEIGDVGLSTDRSRRDLFAAAVETGLAYAEALRVRKVNILAGAPPASQPDDVAAQVLADNVVWAAERLSTIGVVLHVEAVNPFDVPGYWLASLDRALRFLEGLPPGTARLQLDLYHMARTEPDLVAAITRARDWIGHVQFADVPGRHEPGTGEIDFEKAFAALLANGYDDVFSAEYRPRGRTEDGLAWLPAARRG